MRNYAGPNLDDLFSEMDARMSQLATELADIARPIEAVVDQIADAVVPSSDTTHLSHPVEPPTAEPATLGDFDIVDLAVGVGKSALMHGIMVATGLDGVVGSLFEVADGPAHPAVADAGPVDSAPAAEGDHFSDVDSAAPSPSPADDHEHMRAGLDHMPSHTDSSDDFLDDFLAGWDRDKA